MKIYSTIKLGLLSLFIGCQTQQIPITETEWQLVKMYQEDCSTLSPPVTIQFSESDHKVSGFAGCNRFFGSYTQRTTELHITGIGSTKMFCQDAMAVEDNYFKALQEVQAYKIEGNTLLLMTDSNVILKFIKK